MIVDMGQVDESFLTCMRLELAKRAMSQADLARRTNIHPSAVSKIITGKRRPPSRQLAAIALELEIDLREHVGSALRDELRAERARAEQLAMRCEYLGQRVDQLERDRKVDAASRRQADVDDEARRCQLEQRVEQAERRWVLEAEATRAIEATTAARCAELQQRAEQAEHRCAAQAEARRIVEVTTAARHAELEQRAKQAERRCAAEIEARQHIEATAAARCSELERRAEQAEAKCSQYAQAERDRASKTGSKEANGAKCDPAADAEARFGARPFEPNFSGPSSLVVDHHGHARAQADACGGIVGKLVGAGVSAILFRRMMSHPGGEA